MTINSKHFRTRRFARIRHGKKLTAFLAGEATSLGSTAAAHTVSPVHTSQIGPEATITISGGSVAALDTVTLGGVVYKFVAALTEVFATCTLTSDNTNATDGDTVTIGTKVYTLQGTLTNVDGHVKIGADADTTLLNLARAINASGGTPGTDYAAANTVHPTVSASATVTSHAITLTAKASGTAGNAIATTETSSHLSFGAATLTGGVAGSTANEVLVGNGTTDSRDNLIAAITAGAGAGTKYQSNIVANTVFTASAASGNVLVQSLIAGPLAAFAQSLSVSGAHLSAGSFAGPYWTATGHGIVEGQGPYLLTNSGGALPAGAPTAEVYVHVKDANTIGLAVGREALRTFNFAGNTTAGTGTHSIARDVTAQGILETLKRGVKPRTVAAATDVDGL